uniref:Putative 8.9 kDa protein n=1 Tax=Ixodes ricinus TaxID=34613 RepID=A0A0K8RLX6_IXORI
MQFPAVLLCGVLALAAVWNLSNAHIGEVFVTVQDGKCLYENVTLEDGQAYHSEHPCQIWLCSDVQETN